ncbi:hypothetical protein [Corynebacterium sp. TAE3-ERU16]|uniref:hypothetical protein n=1 Tax=Corynebacterium sp. TAE3-ERU16 TaxID=2849493 RepID=UPI001C44A1C9|nr:hypothetical protein [Corynebacterium sp. TAE3-ERU16]MBV7292340.1 hypothetical protein [Corynebacterium sp. TAE3-ERU16]
MTDNERRKALYPSFEKRCNDALNQVIGLCEDVDAAAERGEIKVRTVRRLQKASTLLMDALLNFDEQPAASKNGETDA